MRHIHHWLMVLKVSSTHFSFHRTWVYTPTLTREDSNVSYFKRAVICSISRNIEEEQISKKETVHNPVNPVSKSNDDLNGQVIGLAMKVHRTLGPGFLESVYQKSLLYELVKAGLKVESDRPIQVRYEGVIVGDFKADLIVNEELIIELKAVSGIIVEHEVQLVNYLAATGKDFGLLINFGGRSLEFKKKFRKAKIEDISLQ